MSLPALITCGRGLAPDCGVSVHIIIGHDTAIGGKPPPTLSAFDLGERHG